MLDDSTFRITGFPTAAASHPQFRSKPLLLWRPPIRTVRAECMTGYPRQSLPPGGAAWVTEFRLSCVAHSFSGLQPFP